MSSVPADLFSSATPEDFSTDAGDGAAADTEPVETPESPESAPEEGAEAEPVEDVAAEPEEEEAAEEQPEAEPEQVADPATEELPEGVRRGKDRNGKEGLWLTPQRYETFHGAHKTLQDAAQQWGEPVTAEGLQLRHDAYVAQERMYSDLLSGDPATQANVLKYFLQEGARAAQEGEVGADPSVSLAKAMYDTFREGHPDAYASLRMQAAKDLVQELYDEAGTAGNKNLWVSLAHVASALGLPFRKTDELSAFKAQQDDPVLSLQRENQQLKEQLNGRAANNQAAQFDTWRTTVDKSIAPAILEQAVTPALAETKEAWANFPEAYQDLVVDRLHSAVTKAIRSDAGFSGKDGTIARLMQAASRATSAQKRAEIGEQIQRAYVNKAKLAIDAHKPAILRDAARILKERSDANHQRRNAAPNRGPKGAAAPVNRTAIPSTVGQVGGTFSVDQAMKDMARLFG